MTTSTNNTSPHNNNRDNKIYIAETQKNQEVQSLDILTAAQHKNTYTNISKGLEELKKTVASPTSSALKFINSIKYLIHRINLLFENFTHNTETYEERRAHESYRTQEHLIYGGGSYGTVHNEAFLNSINENSGENFKKLSTEYDQMVVEDINMKNGIVTPWATNIREKLDKLNPGESVWIKCSPKFASHAMMMRIEKCEGSFTLHFANTGSGLENKEFHPSETMDDGTKSICLVARMENIPLDTLLQGDFFERLGKTLRSKSSNDEAPKSSSIPPGNPAITALYNLLKTLLEDEKVTLNATRHDENWGSQQFTYSCGASCVRAMFRTYLTSDELDQLEVNMQVKSLVKHYKQIESGKDTSSTRKIMVLDLIQLLKKELSGADLELLKGIETKVKKSLEMHNAELKISISSRVKIDQFIKKGKDGYFEFAPFIAKISKDQSLAPNVQDSILKANVKIEKNLQMAEIPYKVKKNEKGQWEGVDLNDKIALVGFQIANGDHSQTDVCMQDLIKELSKQHALRRNLTEDEKEKEYLKQSETGRLLTDLTSQFRVFDNTRSGIAKQVFLSTLSIQLFCERENIDFNTLKNELWKIDIKDANFGESITDRVARNIATGASAEGSVALIDFIKAKILYANLKVENYLDSDNIWIQGLRSINGLQPSLRPPSHPSIATEEYDIAELLENEPETEGNTNQVALQALQQDKNA